MGENQKGKPSLRGPQKEGPEPWDSLKEKDPRETDLLPKFRPKTFAELNEMESQDKKLPQGRKNKRKKEQKLFPLIRDCKPPRNYERIKGSLNKGIPTQILKEGRILKEAT